MTVTAAPLEPVRFVLECGTRYSMTVANVGLACCAIEFVAATMLDSADLRRTPVSTPVRNTEVLVVSGTVTDKLAPALRRMYDALPQPAYVMAFGACASSGGPYWDSYSVVQGVGQILPVDVYVPGCPPRPAALLDGLRTLQAAVAAGHPPGSVPREAALQDLRA